MKISTEIASAARKVGYEKAVELVAEAGFDAWDLSMFDMVRINGALALAEPSDSPLCSDGYAAYVKNLKRIGNDNGIVCNQAHAPFPSAFKNMEKYLLRALECTAIAGGKICVIHPDNNRTAEENALMYERLLPFAHECGVKIAVENMWNWNNEADHASAAACSSHDDFLRHLTVVNDDYLVACVDIGHAEMKGLDTSAPKMIRTLGKYVQALHIHDNDRWHDSHRIPFSMDIDFHAVVKALKDIGYDGYFTLEADCHLADFDKESTFKGLKELSAVAKKLADEFDGL
ncbi:MAG: sugar phosphate isomerase/epimerase [Clostridia bacterium]|nr:sugar phosphate isomerase/epimerase [Clostridia bacterium]